MTATERAAARLRLMLEAHRIREFAKTRISDSQLRRAEQVLGQHGAMTLDSDPKVLDLARQVVHQKALRDDPNYLRDLCRIEKPKLSVSDKTIKRRPSDGKPVGSSFDYEEYETRKLDRKAADPVAYERERMARRLATRRYWDEVNLNRAIEAANKGLEGELTCDSKERHRKIWQAVEAAEQSEFVNRVFLRQTDRIFNAKHAPRIRGVGAAAKRAGF